MEPLSRIPPQSEDAERAVLGSALVDFGKTLELCVASRLPEAAFYVPANRTVYATMRVLHTENKAIDIITVADRLRRDGKLDMVGGDLYVHRLIDDCTTPDHAVFHLGIVREKYALRCIIASARDAEAAAYAGNDDAESIRSQAEFTFATLQAPETYAEKTASEALSDQVTRWEQAQTTGCAGMTTGFPFLDKFTGGLLPGALYYVSGEAGTGKTTLVRNISEHVAGESGHVVGFLSLEQTTGQVWGAVAARRASQSVYFLNSGNKRANPAAVAAVAAEVLQWPLLVEDRPHSSADLWSWARRMVGTRKARLLVLDYIQRLTPTHDKQSQEERMTEYSAACTAIAKALRVPFIVISALSREGKLRGSGMLDYDSTAHVRLSRSSAWTPDNFVVTLNFEKQRFGPPAAPLDLRLLGHEQRFVLAATEEDDCYEEAPPH